MKLNLKLLIEHACNSLQVVNHRIKKNYTNDLFHIVIKLLKGILNPLSIYEDLEKKLQER